MWFSHEIITQKRDSVIKPKKKESRNNHRKYTHSHIPAKYWSEENWIVNTRESRVQSSSFRLSIYSNCFFSSSIYFICLTLICLQFSNVHCAILCLTFFVCRCRCCCWNFVETTDVWFVVYVIISIYVLDAYSTIRVCMCFCLSMPLTANKLRVNCRVKLTQFCCLFLFYYYYYYYFTLCVSYIIQPCCFYFIFKFRIRTVFSIIVTHWIEIVKYI